MIAVLCCGPLFDEKALVEEGGIFNFLDLLLSSRDKKVGQKYSRYRLVRYRIRREIGYNAMLSVCMCVCGKSFRARNHL